MVIISFGAGFNLESTDPVYLASMRNISDYARAKGVEMGGYDLLADTRSKYHARAPLARVPDVRDYCTANARVPWQLQPRSLV